MKRLSPVLALMMFGLSVAFGSTHAQKQTAATGEVNLTATSANVNEPGSPVRIRILRWSTDEERSPVVAAMTPTAPATAPPAAAAGLPAGAGPSPSAAAGSPGEPGANPSAAASLPPGVGPGPSAAGGDRGGAAQGGRAAAARGGRGAARAGRGGAGRGGRGDAVAALTPVEAFTAAIGRAPTLGYIWTNDITGYAIKYAYHARLSNGGERIILATDRRLGAYSPAWKPVAAAPVTDYQFTLIEIRLDSRGAGEGTTSLTTKVIVDDQARTVALDNYAATPAIFQNVKR
jgi:hypothetical protein